MTRFNLLLLAALIASGLYLVQVAHQSRKLFTALHRAQNEERQLDNEFERLKSEKQSQATPLRVEQAAREKLAMRIATPAVTQYVTLPPAAATVLGKASPAAPLPAHPSLINASPINPSPTPAVPGPALGHPAPLLAKTP